MIHYLTTRRHQYTVVRFLEQRGAALAGRLRPIAYEDALAADPAGLADGVWIFTDYDRLPAEGSAAAARLWRRLAERGCRMLNHPTRSLRRFALLRRLKVEGINDFDVHHATDLRAPARYPVFVRRADAHSGPLTGLVADRPALERIVAHCRAKGIPFESMIIVEYQDTREPDGIYRKYGFFRVGDRIIPNQVLARGDWLNKEGAEALWSPEQTANELDLMKRNPHAADIRRAFDLAGIEFGRMDYGLADGRIQVWEINTNPDLAGRTTVMPWREEALDLFHARFLAELAAIDDAHGARGLGTRTAPPGLPDGAVE